MQDKIIAAIAAYLEGKMSPHYAAATANMVGCPSCQDFCQEIAAEIAAAIAAMVEAGELNDSQYTDDFLKWRKDKDRVLSTPKEISQAVDCDYSDFDTPF